MPGNRKVLVSVFLTLMMATLPWAAADLSNWVGPPQIASSGQDVEVDGWNVPSNATILDGWLTAEDQMVNAGNGTEWRVDTTTNFSVGQFNLATMDHFDGRLSIEPDDAVSQVDSFVGVAELQFEHSTVQESGNTSIWEPGVPSIVNGTQIGSTMQMPYGNQPANAHGGSLVAATLMNSSVPPGIDARMELGGAIPSPVNHFNLTFWNWRHTDVNDGMWLEYKLDNGPWTWISPSGGYNSNITLNSTATPAGTPNNSTTFPVWSDVNSTGWVQELFILDNLPNINTSVNINFRWRIVTDANSSASPGWFIDDVDITNVGGATGYWHHGCYTTTATTCGYSNNADGILEGDVDLTNAGSGSEIQLSVEWDLEGYSWDNFCVELSSNGQTWTDISSGTSGGGTALGSTSGACNSRSSSSGTYVAIPGSNGYTLSNGTNFGDQTNGFVTLELPIPSTFQNNGVTDIRIRVDTDGSITYGYPQDSQEGLTVDRISVVAANGTILDDDQLSNSTTMTASGLNGATHDWAYISIGSGAISASYGYEDSTATAPTAMAPGWRATGDWEYGTFGTTTLGPISWPSGPFGLGTHLAGSANDGSIDHLYSPPYTIPAGASARLTFEHWMCADQYYAGGAVFISTDNSTWTHFDPGNNWYDVTGYTWGTGTLQNVGIFDGSNNIPQGSFSCLGPHDLWETKVADLSMYSGQTVWFRFTYEPYSSTWSNEEGWYIDDVGLEVDYFYDEGNWISDVLTVDEIGDGFIDIDGIIADDTWASATILDASGVPITGFQNISFPVSLHGLDKDSHQSIRVQVNMGTDNPFLTPIIEAIHVGSIRLMDARGPGNGWDVSSGLDLWNGNLTNNGSAVLQINSEFTHSSRPITSVDFTGIGSQVTLRAIDSTGAIVGQSGLSGTINFAEPQPGFGVRMEVNPGGHISALWAEGEFGQPAVNPEADVTSDGTVDWSFPAGNSFGFHGWQQMIHQTVSQTGTTTHTQDTSSLGVGTDSFTGSTISVLIPESATVRTTTISFSYLSAAGATVDLSIGASPTVSFTPGFHTVCLTPAMMAYMNMVQPSYTDSQTGRDWRVVEFDFSSSGYVVIDVNAITVGYSILENVTGLTQQMVDFHRVEIASGGESVDIPLTYTADAGAVVFDGGIHHELMITNYPFTVPNTLYPDGNVVEITTQHRHLYDNDAISKINLTGIASDGNTILVEVTNPSTSAIFTQPSGSNVLPMQPDCSVTEIGGLLEVKWRFLVSWTWDDVSQIDWFVLGQNITGEAIAPAAAQSGGTGSQAVENDLEVSGFEVFDDQGRHLSNQFSPDYPFHARSGHALTVSGTVRFQNTIDLRPQQSDFAMIVNISGHEVSMLADGTGTFSGTTILEPAESHSISPRIGRVGPITGATGANDSTISPPVVTVLVDDAAPIASNFLVSTSVGQIDANGYVWDPVQSLTVHITVSDAEDRDDEVTLHYWREGIDDDGDGLAQADEYQTQVASLNPLRTGSQQVSFSNIQVAGNGFNGKVSLWLEGTDWAGNSYQEGGTGGGPGLSSDWATLQIAENTETTLLNTGFELDAWDEHLLAGQEHTISMVVQDANGVETLDDIAVYLAGQNNAPLGQFHYDPRDDILTSVVGSHIEPIVAVLTPLSIDSSRIDITFRMDWDTPTSDGWYVPGVTVTDDTSIVANMNNLNTLRWKLDNVLVATATDLVDLTPPFSNGSSTFINVQEGDEIAVEGVVLYGATSAPMQEPSEGLAVIAQILFGSTVVYEEVLVQDGGTFNAPLVLPDRTPPVQELLLELRVLNLPGLGTSVPNYDSVVVVDSAAPEVVFDQFLFPMSSLLRLESDRLDEVLIDIQIDDSGGMPDENVTVHWDYYRNGLPRLGVGGTGELSFVSTTGTLHHFTTSLDLRPKDGNTLLEGDQIVFWFEATDLAGNELQGDGTEDTPRVPLLTIIEFVPVLESWSITPDVPEFGESVSISAKFVNQGIRAGNINVTLAEYIADSWHLHDSIIVDLSSRDSGSFATFEWEAWKTGEAELYIYIDGDLDNRTAVEEFMVAGQPESGGATSTTMLLIAIVGVLGIMVLGLIGVIIFRKPSESMGEYMDESWDDEVEESFGMTTNNVRLDYEDDTLWNTVSRHGIYDKDAFLAHAHQYDRDKDGFLDAEELERAAYDFASLLAQSTAPPAEAEYPFDYNNETVAHIIDSYNIHDKEAFLHFAHAYDEDRNGYLKHSELSRAASDYAASGRNVPAPVTTAPDPRLLSVAEVRAALPDWGEDKVNAWMDKGWTAQQIIDHHKEWVAPEAPAGFGDEYVSNEPEIQVETSTIVEVEEQSETIESNLPSEAAMKRLKKAELVELAELQGLSSSGTKADIIARLLG